MFRRLLGLAAVVGVAVGDYYYSDAVDANGNRLPTYSPGRPPSVPLAVRSPYLSAWSSTANNQTLNSGSATFWSGIPLGWDGMVVVDGVTYEYMGTGARSLQRMSGMNLQAARPKSVAYDSHWSNFTFLAGPVEITASFFSPVTPKDLCRTSIPLSYLTTRVCAVDNRTHSIQVYSDVDDAWTRRDRGSPLVWDLVQNRPANGTTAGKTQKRQSGNPPAGWRRDTAQPQPWANTTGDSSLLYSWVVYQGIHYYLAEQDDMPHWGNFTYTTASSFAGGSGSRNNRTDPMLSFESGDPVAVRFGFVSKHTLTNAVERNIGGAGGRPTVFAFAHDFGDGVSGAVEVRYTIGSVQTPAARYLYYGGVAQLRPWWHTCYGDDLSALVRFHWDDYGAVAGLAADFEATLHRDIQSVYADDARPNGTSPVSTTGSNGSSNANANTNGNATYVFDPNTSYGFLNASSNATGVAVPDVSEADALYAILALSARQVMGAYIYAIPPTATDCAKGPTTPHEPLMFQKEVSSDGNLNTIDVIYPAAPFFLWANADMLKYMLQPAFEMQEGSFYPNSYCAHDIGAQFPNATGHVEGNDEYMPVEESGNLILLAYAYYRFSGDAAWLASHYELLQQFAQYLVDFSLVPAVQLSTDDFAGTLANQTNLAIKGILGIQAMSRVADVVAGERKRRGGSLERDRAVDTSRALDGSWVIDATSAQSDSAYYGETAHSYYGRWRYFAVDPSESHTVLAYQWRSSWGLLYNVYMDRLLQLDLVDERLYAMQSAWYAQVSQVFGVPLDNRHHYTKSDWMMWAAATCTPDTRRLLVTSLAYWLNNTGTEHPFSDLFETIADGYYPQQPNDIRFKARPVVGGHFALLALARVASAQPGGSSPVSSSTPASSTSAPRPLPTPATAVVVSGGDMYAASTESTVSVSVLTMTTTVVSYGEVEG